MTLSVNQDKFLIALLESSSITEACKKSDINRKTAYRYFRDDDFKREYRALSKQLIDNATLRLQKASERAVSVLVAIMYDEDVSASARVQSAKNILELSYKAFEMDNIVERLEKLELMLNESE